MTLLAMRTVKMTLINFDMNVIRKFSESERIVFIIRVLAFDFRRFGFCSLS